jgi:signal transduction histidine kinase
MPVADAGNSVSRWRAGLPAVAAALAAVSVACAVASLPVYAYNASHLGAKVHYLFADDLVVGILYPLVGAFLVRRRPQNAVGWVLVLTSVLGVNALANQYAVAGLLVSPGSLPGATAAAWVAAWGWTPELVVLVFLPLLFPDGALPSPRWRPFARVAAGCCVLLVVAAMVSPTPIDASRDIRNPAGTVHVLGVIVVVMVAVIALVLTPAALAALGLRQRRAAGAERAQLQWLSLAVVVTIVLGTVGAAVRHELWQEVLDALAFAAIPVGIVIAVVRYRLFDVEMVLNRTVVYGLLTSVVLAGYLVAVVGVDQAAQRTGLVAVVVLALVAASARDRMQRWVDRLLFGYRKDPYAVVSRVGQRLDDAAGPLDALRQLTTELRTVLRLPSAEVIPDDPGLPPAGSGRSVAGTVDIPVAVQGQHLATLRVGRRHNGERFRPDEMSALTDVARRAGEIVQAAILIAELQRSRETLVTAREEERRRLHRDLHDGVGPELAGLALQLDSLAGRLAGQPDLADRARALRDRMRQTVTGVRRVVDDLRPPALDELGLADALRQHFAVYPATQVVASALSDSAGISAAQDQDEMPAEADPVQVTAGVLPPLPAAVEVAAYRIASEAVANAFRHGHATACTVRLSADGTDLHLDVRDDGTGIPPDAVRGVGLASMRDRAAELGGELSIDTGSSGTALHARLPLGTGP